jgi:hypothetical protein
MLIRILIFLLFQALSVSAQSNNEFESWQQQEQEDLQQFVDENDQEFLSFLEKEWQEWQGFQGIVQDKTPKPIEMPVVVKPPLDSSSYTPPPIEETHSLAPSLPKAAPEVKRVLPQVEEVKPREYQHSEAILQKEEEDKLIEFNFFGSDLKMTCGGASNIGLGEPLDKESITTFWKAASLVQYEECLNDAQEKQAKMSLNDWGYYLLLHQIGAHLFGENQNQVTLFTWFMMSKSGYQAKVGYAQDRVYLLLPTEQALYGIPYFTFNNTRFYEVSIDGSARATSLTTYDGNYPGAKMRLNLKVARLPQIGGEDRSKTFSFAYLGQEYQVPVHFEQGAIDFFAEYPQTEMGVYFEATPSPKAQASLLNALKPIVDGKAEADAVNLLLRFVQTAFEYQVDAQQFGREKPFFPEEIFFYPFSDCEDRAVLFALLVRELLGLEVIGLDYPGHLATAVKFNGEISGDSVLYQGQRYTVCDPTYINAEAGMTMSTFNGVHPEIIPIRIKEL